MASQGLFSIGGIASGLDTASIITQLMQLERQPVVRLQGTQAALRKTDDAWTQVATRLSALRSATDAIARPDRFSSLVAVSSSDPAAVSVAKAGAGEVGALSFAVEQLAAAHQVALRFDSADAPLAGDHLSVQVGGGEAVTVALDGTKTLTDVARELNAAKGGVSATVLRVGEGDHRLVLTATQTGAASTIAVSGSAPAAETLRAAADAVVVVGTGANALRLTRASNTIDDLVPGASVTLHKATGAQQVDVTSSRDVDGAVNAVKAYVEALNSAISTLHTASTYNAESKVAGPLQGDPSARRLLASLRTAVSAPLATAAGPYAAGHQVGLEVDRRGAVVLDEAALRTALSADFDAVGRLFGRSGSATSGAVSGVTGTAATAQGVYEVQVTETARAAQITGSTYVAPKRSAPATFTISSGGASATVTLTADHSDANLAAVAIRDALSAAGMTGITAGVDAGRLTLATTRTGSAATFSVVGGTPEAPDATAPAFGLAGTHTGSDAVGGIRPKGSTDPWSPLTGSGRTLSVADGPARGLSLTFDGAPGAFEVTYSHGLAGGVGSALASAEGVNGLVARARTGITDQIRIYQTRIDAFDQRLATREATLRRQFTAMETALAALNAQSSWLTSQLAGLNGLQQGV